MGTGVRFKNIRMHLGYETQKAFGKEFGVQQYTISDIENERQPISMKVMEKLHNTWNVNLNYLVGGTGEMFHGDEKKAGDELREGSLNYQRRDLTLSILQEQLNKAWDHIHWLERHIDDLRKKEAI